VGQNAVRQPTPQPTPLKTTTSLLCEVDPVPGLEALAFQEVGQRFGKHARFRHGLQESADSGAIQLFYSGPLAALLELQTVLSAYLVCFFDVPRPQALLGHEHFQQLLEKCRVVCALSPDEPFTTLYVDAAGADSSVMTRLKNELAAHLNLRVTSNDGDLLLRIRRPQGSRQGWEVLIRLSSRPLSVRRWRVCDRQGGLNAAVAHAMVYLTKPVPEDRFLNIACGSGTLLIERKAHGPAKRIFGCDIDAKALDCAQMNITASGYREEIELYQWDAQALPIPDRSVDVICADLPFGKSIGSHQANLELYPRLLQEAARVAKPGARACVLTHEVRLMDSLLDSSDWVKEQVFMLSVGGLHPRIYLINRR
jgi:ubiquinone/menaquinone biosynthesis C-methylase UbiE